jgi:spore maturation protein CgeB
VPQLPDAGGSPIASRTTHASRTPSFVVAAPTKVGRAKVGKNLGDALRRLGHRVTFFDYDGEPLRYRVWPRSLRRGDWRQRCLDYVNARALDVVRAVRPDVFLCVKGVQLRPETIRAIGQLGVMTVGYWIDDPLDHARSMVNAPSYDLYFTNDAASVERYRREGLTRIGHLRSAADPEVFFPLPDARPTVDVVFVGTHSPDRESVVVGLQEFDTHVYGSAAWRRSPIAPTRVHPGAFGARTNEVFNRARINLNVHRWSGLGSAMNLRLFEVPAARGFLLTDWVAEIDGGYRPDEHLVCWRTMRELRAKVAYYLEHEDERREIAARGYEHFLQHHTYAVRVRELLEHLT